MTPATTPPALSVMSTGLRISLLVAATLFSSAALSSTVRADASAVAGHWEGEIEIPGSPLGIKVDLEAPPAAGGGWSGTIDIPMQSAKGLALGGVEVDLDAEPPEVRFAITGIPGDPRFEGTVEGDAITGTFRQGALAVPFTLGREVLPPPPRPQEPKPPFPYSVEEVAYDAGDVRFAGTLTVPQGEGPFPAALLLSGSGAQDRDESIFEHRPFWVLADHLSRAGVAVLRLDDRGVGGSSGDLAETSEAELAEDALAGVRFLAARDDVDGAKIGLIGHSDGGIVAPLAASRSSDVAFVVMLAGTGVPGREVLVHQIQLSSRVAGVPEAVAKRIGDAMRKAVAVVESGLEGDELRAKLRPAAEELLSAQGTPPESEDAADAAASAMAAQLSGRWFRSFLAHDPRPVLRELKVPVLALNGALDRQVDPKQNLPPIAEALFQAETDDVTVMLLPRLNHLFQTAVTGLGAEYGTIEETLAPRVLDLVRDWILERFAPGPREAAP